MDSEVDPPEESFLLFDHGEDSKKSVRTRLKHFYIILVLNEKNDFTFDLQFATAI